MDWKRVLSLFQTSSLVAGGVLSLSSCGSIGEMMGGKKESGDAGGEKPLTGMEAYQRAGGRIAGVGGVAASGTVTASVSSNITGITAEEDIYWAPEDPDAPMGGGFEQLWKQPENTSWNVSYTEAMRFSRESGKPLLIWFTDSARSPLCKALSGELFSNTGFDGWASKKIVRLRVDNVIRGVRAGEDEWTQKKKYIESLKSRYKVLGHPTVLVLSPSGAVVGQFRGYKKGTPDYYWGRIKSAVDQAERDYGQWREKYEKRGYRLWTNRQGRKTFAKLYRFNAGRVTLVDPDGNRGSTTINKLSDADQQWIMEKKLQHDARRRR
ncbi:thioredoxin family protein [Verrucomicrobiaceae bacterium 5K15]|uniref:Thioredoxin family protein n=1 Tax=Oceaniferula flava TaxID=2800421 RepID=A0AAE2SD38_9BACT|nr:thioredoxin family protein [Oceaniferula flavus]MBK1854679.1 thioredoxin family protein [Oceaniferula flavus]MBM1135985.1 thioredoxin family protein [Oceaniferula flavus]